jgi:hypothetical protein
LSHISRIGSKIREILKKEEAVASWRPTSYRSKRRRITQEVNNQLLALHSLTPNLRLAQLELGQSEETCRNINDEEHFNSLVTVDNLDLPILDFSPSLDKCNFV